MTLSSIKLYMRNSRIAGIYLFPLRLRAVTKYCFSIIIKATKWLFGSNEHTNYTYELSKRNMDHLIWFVSEITKKDFTEIQKYVEELSGSSDFDDYLSTRQRKSGVSKQNRGATKIGRRIAWYATIRALKPNLVVETGTDKGLGSLVMAQALKKNGIGKLITIDINPGAGELIGKEYADTISVVYSDSLKALSEISKIDIFIHDSNHSGDHEFSEYQVVGRNLSPGGLVLSDNAHATDSLSNWSKENSRRFLYFEEQPKGHWYPGASFSASLAD